jgi:hypothetical protein
MEARGLLLVPVVEVDVDHLERGVDDRGIELEGAAERALGQDVVLGPP